MENLNAESVKRALDYCKSPKLTKCDGCPREQEDGHCMYRLNEDALALINSQEQRIKELTEECEKYQKIAEKQQGLSMDRHFEIKRLTEENAEQDKAIINALNRIREVRRETIADTVREIFNEIYASLNYIEEQMEPEEIPECLFSVREDIDALKVRFEGEGKDNG